MTTQDFRLAEYIVSACCTACVLYSLRAVAHDVYYSLECLPASCLQAAEGRACEIAVNVGPLSLTHPDP